MTRRHQPRLTPLEKRITRRAPREPDTIERKRARLKALLAEAHDLHAQIIEMAREAMRP